MDPLSKYLLTLMKGQPSVETKTYRRCEEALRVLGYWLLMRACEHTRESIPPCRISDECMFIESFESYCTCLGGYNVFVDVYADPDVAMVRT